MIVNIVYGVGYSAARYFYMPNIKDLRQKVRTNVLNHAVCQPGSILHAKLNDPANHKWYGHLTSDLSSAEHKWLKAAEVLRYIQIGVDLAAIIVFGVNPISMIGYIASPVLGPVWNIVVPVGMCALGFVSPIFLIVPLVQAVCHLAPNLIEWYIINSDLQKLENCLHDTKHGLKLAMPISQQPEVLDQIKSTVCSIPGAIAEFFKSLVRHQNDNCILRLQSHVSDIAHYDASLKSIYRNGPHAAALPAIATAPAAGLAAAAV